jgi:hypothetical protein
MHGDSGSWVLNGPLEIRGGFGWSGLVLNTQQGLPSYMELRVGTDWYVDISTHSLGSPLEPGVYSNAERAAFTDPNRPGLDVFGDGRGCNKVTGQFEILDSRLGGGGDGGADAGTPRIESITVVFEQHCEGAPPALLGCFHFQQQ